MKLIRKIGRKEQLNNIIVNFFLQYISFLFLQDDKNMHTVACSRNSRACDIINCISIKQSNTGKRFIEQKTRLFSCKFCDTNLIFN